MSPPRVIPIQEEDGQAPWQAGIEVSRRHALKLLATAAAAAAGCTKPPVEPIHQYMAMPENTAADATVFYASAHVREGYAHGVLVGTQDGRPIKIEGHRAHPASLGATDIHAQASLLALWDPDRSKTVLRRVSAQEGTEPRPEVPALAAATWDDFEQAWRPVLSSLDRQQGRGLYVLTAPFSSPTQAAQLDELRRRWPDMAWVGHEAVSGQRHVLNGARLAFGRSLEPIWRLDVARVVLSLGADLFSGGPASVRHAMDWSRQRYRPASERPRLFVAETSPGLMGARADRRIALTPPEIEALAWRLANRLLPSPSSPGLPAPPSPAARAFEEEAVAQLRAAGDHALVVAGPGLSPQAQAAVHLINHSLGAAQRTVDWIEPVLAQPPLDLQGLLADLHAGKVQALWILGANPVYDLPPATGFAQALSRVPFSVHLGGQLDETAARCQWHLPESHGYEQWSDARAFDGTVSLLQPAIMPLYDTRSAHEVLALLGGHGTRKGYEIVRGHWRERLGSLRGAAPSSRQAPLSTGDGFEDAWRAWLRAGLIAGTAARPVQMLPPGRLAPLPPPPALQAGQLVLDIVPDYSVRDGAYSNNAWLQELPRPFTQLTWDNALHLGPATARGLGLATGDVVTVQRTGGQSLHAPVWVQHGHAEGAATLHTGYGRWQAGRVGNGVGVNANVLRQPSVQYAVVTLARTGRRHAFAVRQLHMDQEGRELARTVREGQAASPDAPDPSHEHARPSLYPDHSYPTHAWAMVVDLDACIGCGACTVACQAENNIPTVGPEEVAHGRAMHWIRVDAYHEPEGGTMFQPVPCMHCEKAPCELVCPVGATLHDSEGLNAQVYNRCIGTRFCSNNCPYKVRRFNFLQYSDNQTETLRAMRNPEVTVRGRGVMEKCTYCVQRISQARRESERTGEPLRDGDVVTACQAVCPTRAITFGDLNDPRSEVVRARQSERHYAMLAELNTQPRTTYLARRASPLQDQG